MSAAPFPAPPRPEALAPKTETIPDGLKGYRHFLVWDWRLRQGADGPRWTKPPLKVTGAGNAKSTDPNDWGTLAAAVETYRTRRLAGIGFALAADDPFVFGDVDDCRDPETGAIAAWAKPLLARFAFTYQEVSPSGTGVKIIAKGTLPGAEHRWRLDPDDPLAYVEWFDRGKYTTLTGRRLEGAAADVADAGDELARLYAEVRPRPAEKPAKPLGPADASNLPADPDDDALLQKARSSKDGPRFIQLFDVGNIALYNGDESAADIALCGMLAFWLGPDPDRIDRVFRRSALVRAKWLEREDYRRLTIDKVLSGRADFYTPREPKRLRVVDPDAEAAQPKRRTRWSATDLLSAELPEPRWAVPDLIPEGLIVLAGRPKKGKSRMALSLAISIASKTPALGHFEIEQHGDVLFIGLEDNERRLQDRLQDMVGSRGAPPTLELWTDLPRVGEGCEVELERWLKDHPQARLIVIDTYQRVRKPQTGRDGNAYAMDYEEAAALQRIAIGHGLALMLILHTRKPVGGGDPFDDVLGSTGNTASADALMVLQTERGEADAKLLVVGRDIEEAEHALQTDHITGDWRRIGDAADVRRSSQREAILAALRAAAPKGLKPYEIARYTNETGPRVRTNLMRMKNDGEVLKENDTYFIRTDSDPTTSGNGGNAKTVQRGNVVAPVAPVSGVAGVAGVAAPERVSWYCDPCKASVRRGYRCMCGGTEEG